jgi:heme exporter protein C
MWTWFFKLASPPHVYGVAGRLHPWLIGSGILAIAVGSFAGLFLAPPDYQQGDGFRIIYVHVPSAYLSMLVYVTMAFAAGVGLIWRMKVAHAVAASCAAIGASFTLVALLTGAIWGKPMWGTYWVWDPRLTSELVLLFLYLGYMSIRSALEDSGKADQLSAVLALAGLVNIPIIHYSVVWWASLHQGPTLSKMDAPSIVGSMLWPLLVNILGFTLLFLGLLAIKLRGALLVREVTARWVRDAVGLR